MILREDKLNGSPVDHLGEPWATPLESTKLAPVPPGGSGPYTPLGGAGTAPPLTFSFQGPVYGDTGATTYPPDTCGAAGTNHFVAATNFNVSYYLKSNGTRVFSASLNTFFNTGAFIGDPRVAFDANHAR